MGLKNVQSKNESQLEQSSVIKFPSAVPVESTVLHSLAPSATLDEFEQNSLDSKTTSLAQHVLWTSQIENKVNEKFRRVRTAYYAHHAAADLYGGLAQWIGLAVVIINIVTGSAIFTTLGKEGSDQVKIYAGIVTVSAGILAAVQTFCNFTPKSAKHRLAANRYSDIRRRLDSLSVIPREHRGDAKAFLVELDKELSTATDEFPEVSNWMHWISEVRNRKNKSAPLFQEEV